MIVFLLAPVMLTMARMLLPSTIMPRICARRSIGSLFMLPNMTPLLEPLGKRLHLMVLLCNLRPGDCRLGYLMNRVEFSESKTGRLVPTIQGHAFVPDPLPPAGLDLGPLVNTVARAATALGELSGIGRTVASPFLLVRPFMRREAVASSKIEGTVTTLTELLLFEVEKTTTKSSDTREVMNYVRALEHSLKRLSELPVCLRLIREAHRILLSNVSPQSGASITPGEFRVDQNWIGARTLANARFVPPPPQEVIGAMSALETYIHKMDDQLPLIVNLALIHYQFEAIHPFRDGNGRVGRLLMPLLLCEQNAMSQPLLYMSPFFEKTYDEYVDALLNVSKKNKWAEWVEFFLRGVENSANEAMDKAKRLQDLQRQYHDRVQRARSSVLLGRIIDNLFEHPALSVPYVAQILSISYNAAKNNVERLIEHDIISEAEFYHFPKAFVAKAIIEIMNE